MPGRDVAGIYHYDALSADEISANLPTASMVNKNVDRPMLRDAWVHARW